MPPKTDKNTPPKKSRRTNNRPWKSGLQQAKREAAELRQRQRDARSPQQQLDRLDSLLGVGVGAQRERARLLRMLEAAA